MTRTSIRITSMLALSVAILALAGCPPTPVLEVDRAELEFTATDSQFPVSITSQNGALEWTAEAEQPWLMVDVGSGTGDAQINVMIDRSQLDPSRENTGTVRVRAGEQEIVIEVSAVSAFTPVNTAYFPMAVGNSWTYSLEPLTGPAGLSGISEFRLDVASRIEMAGLEIWQVECSLPELATGIPLLKGATVDSLMGGSVSFDTYWVFVDGVWYITTARENLDALPETTRFLPLSTVLQWPGTLVYLQESGLLESALNEITGIFATAQRDFGNNYHAIGDYTRDFVEGNTGRAFSLFRGFGQEFSGYSSGDPVLDALVQLLADSSLAVEPAYRFLEEFSLILVETSQNLTELQDPPISLAYWTAWEAEFGEYQNVEPALQALVRLFSHTALEFSVQLEAIEGYTRDDLFLFRDYYVALGSVMDENAGLFLTDPAAYIDVLQEFVSGYPAYSSAMASVILATSRVLADIEVTLPVLEEFMAFPIDTTGLRDLVLDISNFNQAYQEQNGYDPVAAYVAVLIPGVSRTVSALTDFAPTLNTLATDYENLESVADTQLLATFDIDNVATVLRDFETYFETYAEDNNDALAEEYRIYARLFARSLSAFSRVIDAAENAPYEDVAGTLASLLPDTPIRISLNQFGVNNPSDCISPRILVETNTETLHIASTIYARDLGPVLLAFMPLQYGTVDGSDIGTPPYR